MGKIIIVTFAFMAFAFYELSGGDAFVPIADEKRAALALEEERVRVAQAEAKAQRTLALATQQQATRQASTTSPEAGLVLASTTANEKQTPTGDVMQAIEAALEVDKAENVTAQEPSQSITASLEDTQDAAPTAAAAETSPADVREVTAARVNMRNGPGQTFNVVTKLNGGDQVEILQDPGDGWVKLRVVDDGRVGWMADFLLTAANN